MSLFTCLKRCIIAVVVIVLFALIVNFWMSHKTYLMTDRDVAAIAVKHAEQKGSTVAYDVKKAYAAIHRDLSTKYPGHIIPMSEVRWVFLNTGGVMASICVVHASLTEYILFIGTALNTVKHAGRLPANRSDTCLTGEIHLWKEGEMNAVVYKPGSVAVLEAGTAAGAYLKANTWAVEYSRTFTPLMFIPIFVSTAFHTLDFTSFFTLTLVYVKALMIEAVYYLTHVKELIG